MAKAAARRLLKHLPPAGLAAAIIVAALGPRAHALTGAQIAQYIAAILAGITAIQHGPTVARKARRAAGHAAATRRHRRARRNPQRFVTVWDSTTITALGRLASTSPDAIIAYDDGLYNNLAQVKADYPGHRHYTIAVFPQDDANFLDVERSDAMPGECAAWLRRQARRVGITDTELMHRLVAWIADPTGIPHIPRGYQGCQWDWHALGRNLDESLFYASALEGDPIGLYANASTWARIIDDLKASGLG